MAIESWTHAHGIKLEETIVCTEKEELESIKRVIPQTFAGFDYTMTTKQKLKGWRIRIVATRKPSEGEKQITLDAKEVADAAT